MPQIRSDLARAFALFNAGHLQEAEAACREMLGKAPRDAAAMHLLGLTRKRAGDLIEAERLLRASLEFEPGEADFHTNLAVLLRQSARLEEAEALFRQALALDPGHRNARLELARTLSESGRHAACEAECRILLAMRPRDAEALILAAVALRAQNRLPEAEAAYRQALAVDPHNALAHHNLGALLSQMERAEEAFDSLSRARDLGLRKFELAVNLGRTLTQLYRIEEAERAFVEAVALDPHHPEAQLNLARLRYMQGDPDFTRALVQACEEHPGDAGLRMLHARILRRAGNLRGAARGLQELLVQDASHAEARAELAAILHEGGHLAEAESLALEAAAARPGDPSVIETLVLILLARGLPDEALQFIRPQRQRVPHEQTWIAYEATAHRLCGNDAYRELYDYDRLVRVYDAVPPPGWSSMAELNAAVLRALETRHRFPAHPLDQSLRNGSQTARSLLTDSDPAIQAVLGTFSAPIADYLRSIGRAPDHPLSARNRGAARITGAWSVRLQREGFHVNHVHPEGWISSAYYVSVPAESADEQLRSGWLKFGEPRYPVPGAGPERIVQPAPGRLVLFPSYMWHGTNPIHGNEARTTIAFDANPAPQA